MAILGTMNELGSFATEAHTQIAKEAAKQADFFIALGQYAEQMASVAKAAGMSGLAVLSFKTPEQLLEHLDQVIKAKDVVYIKASQNGMFLERIVKRLMAKPELAGELLVRQSRFWDHQISKAH